MGMFFLVLALDISGQQKQLLQRALAQLRSNGHAQSLATRAQPGHAGLNDLITTYYDVTIDAG